MSNKVDYAYIAGIIDSDGCIQIVNDKSQGWNSWKLMVSITNGSQRLLNKVVGIFGGNYYIAKNDTHVGQFQRKHVSYHYAICGNNAYKMLKKVKPYLTEKKPQADVGIHFFIHQRNTTYARKKGLPETVIRKREEFKRRLKELKTAFLTPIALAETECENTVMGEATVQPN